MICMCLKLGRIEIYLPLSDALQTIARWLVIGGPFVWFIFGNESLEVLGAFSEQLRGRRM